MWNQSAAVSVITHKTFPVTSLPAIHPSTSSTSINASDHALQPASQSTISNSASAQVSAQMIDVQMQQAVGTSSTNPTPRNPPPQATSRTSRMRSDNDKCGEWLVTCLLQVWFCVLCLLKNYVQYWYSLIIQFCVQVQYNQGKAVLSSS